MKYFYSLLAIAIGFLMMRYSVALTDMFGKIDFAERNLRSGLAGTYSLYRLVGLAIIILALLYIFGAADFLINPLAPLFGGTK